MTYEVVRTARGRDEVVDEGGRGPMLRRLRELRASTRGGRASGRGGRAYPVRYSMRLKAG